VQYYRGQGPFRERDGACPGLAICYLRRRTRVPGFPGPTVRAHVASSGQGLHIPIRLLSETP